MVRDCFPRRLKEIRASLKLTQVGMAEKLGVSRASYSMYETGKNLPDIEMLDALHRFTGLPFEYIIGNTDNSTTEGIDIEQEIGLSNEAVLFLKNNKNHQAIINKMLSSPLADDLMSAIIRYSGASVAEYNCSINEDKDNKFAASLENELATLHSMTIRQIMCDIFSAKKKDDYLWLAETMKFATLTLNKSSFMELLNRLESERHDAIESVIGQKSDEED